MFKPKGPTHMNNSAMEPVLFEKETSTSTVLFEKETSNSYCMPCLWQPLQKVDNLINKWVNR